MNKIELIINLKPKLSSYEIWTNRTILESFLDEIIDPYHDGINYD